MKNLKGRKHREPNSSNIRHHSNNNNTRETSPTTTSTPNITRETKLQQIWRSDNSTTPTAQDPQRGTSKLRMAVTTHSKEGRLTSEPNLRRALQTVVKELCGSSEYVDEGQHRWKGKREERQKNKRKGTEKKRTGGLRATANERRRCRVSIDFFLIIELCSEYFFVNRFNQKKGQSLGIQAQ